MKKLIALLLGLTLVFSMMDACSEKPDSQKGDKEEQTEGTEKETEATQEETQKETEEQTEPEATQTVSNPLVGEWSGLADIAAMCNMLFELMLGEELADYLKIDSFDVTMTFSFDADGNYTIIFDEDDFAVALESASETWIDGYYALIEHTIETENLDMTAEEFAQENFGMSVEEYIEEGFASSMDATAFETYGEYELDENKLYLDGDPEYYTIDLSGDELIIVEYSGGELDGELFADVIFRRQ